ncbi:MAG: tRNA (adenosine(37)-N6)-threonylcarbamoyltransferase complex dimerization subunit type 1 TsaB [Gemmatimonadales bacterium]
MITLALDTATDRCSVAVSDGTRTAAGQVDGARRHAGSLLGLIDSALGELDASPAAIGRIIMADGPGSFTGLRVAAAVAKALSWHRQLEWRVAPSLLARAAQHVPPRGGVVVAASDALRGELYAACWRFGPGWLERLGSAARAMPPESLKQWASVDVVVGSIPPTLVDRVKAATNCEPIVGEAALPHAATLLALVTIPGATTLVSDAAAWAPEYGRPAEAQVVWERAHGRTLPPASGIAR